MDSKNNISRKKRVLILGFTYIVGVYQSKLKTIQDAGMIDIAWLAPIKWKMRSWNREIPLKVRYKEIKVYPARIKFLNGVNGGYLYPILSILKAISEFKPDILHYEQEVFSLSAFQIALISRVTKIPLTVFCWENIDKFLPFYRRWTTRFVIESSSVIVAGNKGAAQILRRWGFKGEITILPQIGVDTNLFYPRPKVRNDLVFRVGFVGRLVPEKGIDLIFDAARYLLDAGKSLNIIICGNGPYEATLRMYAKSLNLEGNITWLSFIQNDDIPDVMSEMDAIVLPSRTVPGIWKEQFGHVLIEAMAMGIPVIGSDSGAIPDVIGRNDLIFPENDFFSLSIIIEKLMHDLAWRSTVSKYLQTRVFQNFTDQKVAEQLISLWVEICEFY